MNNQPRHCVPQRIQLPLVVLSLLVLLFVVLSSAAQQQFFAARMDQGYVGTLNDLTLASHSESYRTQIGKHKQNTADTNDSDPSDWWCDHSKSLWLHLCANTAIAAQSAWASLLIPRFLLPLLRAPPIGVILR
ncbi:MAG: hypothetical protein WEA82_09595 [Idiomarina sp.]